MGRWLAVGLAVIAGGCGGAAATATAPRLPHALGLRLAAQATAVETSLQADDSCAALNQTASLEMSVSTAIAAGQVPVALRKPLSSSAASLAARVHCVPAPPKPHPDKPHKPHKPHKDHGHGGGKGPGDGGGG